MTMDAMNWVWDHSQSRGNTRLALLYVADQVRTAACEVRLSRSDFMRSTNAAKATVRAALVDAIKLGELELVEPGAGRRKALYRLPGAVGYSRRGSEPDPLENRRGSESAPLRADTPSRRGSESDPLESVEGQNPPRRGSESAPHSPSPKELASGEAGRADSFQVCQPLVRAMTEAGITVSWSMKSSDWIEIANVVQRAGVPAMVAFARDTKATARQPVRYATFFLRGGWAGLPPASASPLPQRTRSVGKPPHCEHPDCDPISRTRETEDARGLRSLHPCPECHPNRKGQAA